MRKCCKMPWKNGERKIFAVEKGGKMLYSFMRFPGGKTKAVTLSYDDGSVYDLQLLETAEKYGLKCTLNLVGNTVMQGSGLKKDEIQKYVLDCGHEIANHGFYHRALDSIRPVEGIRDTLDSRLTLENTFGIIVRGMAFPDRGLKSTDPQYAGIREYLRALDIAYVRTVGGDNDTFAMPEDWYSWMPTAHHTNPKITEFIEKFTALSVEKLYRASRAPRLFFLWGHSAEFARDKNWDRLEEFCKRLAGREDTWYATNMEIYEYTEAYRSLVHSADGHMVHNPTRMDIWFETDGEMYTVRSGETIQI